MDDTLRPLQVLPLGIGDAFTKLDYFCALLVFGGRTVCLIDCPDPIHRILHERATCVQPAPSAENIDHIVLTHLHCDHSNGLESFFFYRKFVHPEDNPPSLYALPEVVEALWPHKLAVAMERSYIRDLDMDQTYRPEEFYRAQVVDNDAPVQIGDLRFEFRRTRHSVPTIGFRVSCGGRMFGYSCDTTFDPAHIEFLAQSDLIFHDCNESVIHTPYKNLLGLPPEIREKLHILHFSDSFNREASELALVQPGRLYTV